MIFPEIVNYILTLRYPGSETGKMNWVCYSGLIQTLIPIFPAGATVNFIFKPLYGHHAWLTYVSKPSMDAVPDAFSGSIMQYGSSPWSGVVTALGREPAEYFAFVTEQEPAYLSITNISPITQRWETIVQFIVIPSQKDMETVLDALRRLNTSRESEELLQQAAYLLGVLSGQPQEPLPPVGGS